MGAAATAVRVLIADDHPMFREAVARVIGDHPDLRLVASCPDGSDALEKLRALQADVAVLDVRMPKLSGIDVVRELADGETQLLLLSAYCEASLIHEGIAAGAKGYLSKDVEPDELCEAILATARGETTLSPELQRLFAEQVHKEANQPRPKLTPREREVLTLVAKGCSTRKIASELYVSPTTVKSHLENAYEKLGVSTRTEAATVALRLGLLD